MKNTLLFAMSLLVLTGCKYTIQGELNVTEELSLGGESYEEGTYYTTLDVKRTVSGKHKLNLNIQSVNGTNTHKFKAPRGAKFPENGRFSISASELKQKYGLMGEVETEYTDDDRRRYRFEPCVYEEAYKVCRTDQNGRTFCRTVYRRYPGNREVEYHSRTIDQSVELDIMYEGRSIANYDGNYLNTYDVVDYVGICRY